jgi:hypothetical protein
MTPPAVSAMLALQMLALPFCGFCGFCGCAAGAGAGAGSMRQADPELRAFREKGLRGQDELTLRDGRLLPETVSKGQAYGVEPGGGARLLVAGMRVLSFADGSMLAAQERFANTPTSIVPVPERLGGGFVYALDKKVWRSSSWLGKVVPVVLSSATVDRVLVGLDRLYLHSPPGGLVALVALPLDTWAVSPDLGPLPRGPNAGRFAVLDAWHGVALADMQGALVTSNAGASWRPVALPVAPTEVKVAGDSLVVGGLDDARHMQWWEVRPDGQTAKFVPRDPEDTAKASDRLGPKTRPFGPVPLKAALEDGFPLVDGTALVLRDGTMARVRLSDGKVVEVVPEAFPLKPARCHPLSLASKADTGAFGFVCGESRGQTIVYRWDARAARPVELRHFAGPRQVLAFGNGALAARGRCDPASDADGTSPASPERGRNISGADQQAFCVMPPGGTWREVGFRGEGADRARLAVLSDGRVAVLRPPFGDDLSTARLAFIDEGPGSRVKEVPLRMPTTEASTTRVLRAGIWRDGFEERRPGVIGGWVDDADSLVGVEIGLDGAVKVGQLVQEAVMPSVSGRWGLGWTASKRGLETTDGGMTWRGDLDLPEPLSRSAAETACGPLGCVLAGWLRVGWGSSDEHLVADPGPMPRSARHGAPVLSLECDTRSVTPPPEPAKQVTSPTMPFGRPVPMQWYMNASAATDKLPALGTQKAPVMRAGDLGISVEARFALDRTQRTSGLARVYAWGPKSGDWDTSGRWQVLWQSPWGSWQDGRSSMEAPSHWTSVELARQALGMGGGLPLEWGLVSDDADHALLVGRRPYGVSRADVWVLETNRAPVEVHRSGGDAFTDLQGAVRLAGHWYIATAQAQGELPATVLWLVDGAAAREVARLPRIGPDPLPSLRLAGREDGRTVGVMLDGQPSTDGEPVIRWVFPVDVETGAVGEAESLGPADLSDRSVSACPGDDSGWLVELPYPGQAALRTGVYSSTLQIPFVRMRLSRDTACVTRIMASIEPWAARPPEPLTRSSSVSLPRPAPGTAAGKSSIEASILSARTRYALECTTQP